MSDCKHRNSKRARMVVYADKRGYRIDEEGRIISRTGRILRPKPGSNGYVRFSIRGPDGAQAQVCAHQLAAYQKYGESALVGAVHVRHLDGNPLNNRPDNLTLGTGSENMLDRPRADRIAHAKRAASFLKKLSDDQVREMRSRFERGHKLKELAAAFGVSMSSASYIVNRKTYKDVA